MNYGLYLFIGIFTFFFLLGIIYIAIKLIVCLKNKRKNIKSYSRTGKKKVNNVTFETKPLSARPIDETYDEIFRSNMSLYSVKKDII